MLGAGFTVLNQLTGRLSDDRPNVGEVATLRPSDQARVFVTSLSFRTGDPRYAWLNTVVGVVEGVLDAVTVGGTAKLRAYTCEPAI